MVKDIEDITYAAVTDWDEHYLMLKCYKARPNTLKDLTQYIPVDVKYFERDFMGSFGITEPLQILKITVTRKATSNKGSIEMILESDGRLDVPGGPDAELAYICQHTGFEYARHDYKY
jgi:hypothetical protein